MEGGIGRVRFLGIYIVSILAGSAGAILVTPNAFTAGASGGVFGLAAAATLGLARRGVRFSQTGWGPILLINLVFTLAIPGISVGGHIGGLAGGVIAGGLVMRPERRPRFAIDIATLVGLAVAAVAVGVWAAGFRA
jgi:membrane associated rhomboid family serine protease